MRFNNKTIHCRVKSIGFTSGFFVTLVSCVVVLCWYHMFYILCFIDIPYNCWHCLTYILISNRSIFFAWNVQTGSAIHTTNKNSIVGWICTYFLPRNCIYSNIQILKLETFLSQRVCLPASVNCEMYIMNYM